MQSKAASRSIACPPKQKNSGAQLESGFAEAKESQQSAALRQDNLCPRV